MVLGLKPLLMGPRVIPDISSSFVAIFIDGIFGIQGLYHGKNLQCQEIGLEVFAFSVLIHGVSLLDMTVRLSFVIKDEKPININHLPHSVIPNPPTPFLIFLAE